MNLRRLSLVPLLLATLLLPAACAESAKNAPGPQAPSAREEARAPEPVATAAPVAELSKQKEEAPDTLEAQMAALAAAEGQIDQLLAGGAKKMAERERDEAAAKAPAAGPKAGVVRGATVAPAKPGDMGNSIGASCSLACSALASMTRAVSHLCALAGEGDRRCEDGRTRERSATQRVHASCPSCSG